MHISANEMVTSYFAKNMHAQTRETLAGFLIQVLF